MIVQWVLFPFNWYICTKAQIGLTNLQLNVVQKLANKIKIISFEVWIDFIFGVTSWHQMKSIFLITSFGTVFQWRGVDWVGETSATNFFFWETNTGTDNVAVTINVRCAGVW